MYCVHLVNIQYAAYILAQHLLRPDKLDFSLFLITHFFLNLHIHGGSWLLLESQDINMTKRLKVYECRLQVQVW